MIFSGHNFDLLNVLRTRQIGVSLPCGVGLFDHCQIGGVASHSENLRSSMQRQATRFTLNNGEVCEFQLPWDCTEPELKMCEEVINLQFSTIRSYRSQVSRRHEWWLKWKEFAP